MSEKVLSKVNNDIFSYDTTGGVFKMSRVMPTEIHHVTAGAGTSGYMLTSTGNGWDWTDPSVLEGPLQVLNLPITNPKTYSTGADGYVLISKGSTDPPLWTNEISIHKVSATNFQCGSRNIVDASAGCSFTALEIKPSTTGASETFLIQSNGDTICHGTLSIDSITRRASTNGVAIENITIDGNVISALNYRCGSRNIVDASAGCSFTALEIKPSTAGASETFLINSNGDTTCHGTLSIDSISEKSSGSGITLSSVVKMTGIQSSTNANKLLYNNTTGEITYQPDSGSLSVNVTNPNIGEILSYDGTNWVNDSNIKSITGTLNGTSYDYINVTSQQHVNAEWNYSTSLSITASHASMHLDGGLFISSKAPITDPSGNNKQVLGAVNAQSGGTPTNLEVDFMVEGTSMLIGDTFIGPNGNLVLFGDILSNSGQTILGTGGIVFDTELQVWNEDTPKTYSSGLNGEVLTSQGPSKPPKWIHLASLSGGVPAPSVQQTLPTSNLSNYDFRTYTLSGSDVMDSDGNIIFTSVGSGTISFTTTDGVFTGSSPNQYILKSGAPPSIPSGNFSIEFYTKFGPNPSDYHYNFYYENGSTNSYIVMYIRSTGKFYFETWHNSPSGAFNVRVMEFDPFNISGGGTWDSTNFNHFVVTYSGGGTEKFYINGSLISSSIFGGFSNTIVYDEDEAFNSLYLGGGGAGSSDRDKLDETTKFHRMYDGILTEEQVSYLYENRENQASTNTQISDVTNYHLVSKNATGTETEWSNDFGGTYTSGTGVSISPSNVIDIGQSVASSDSPSFTQMSLGTTGANQGILNLQDITNVGNENVIQIKGIKDGTNGGQLQFHTKIDGGATTEKLIINNVGAIGIGGANYGDPGQVLQSNGSDSAVSWTMPTSVTVDTAITNGSTNPVTNDAIHDALALKANLSNPIFPASITAGAYVACHDVYLKKSDGSGTSRLYTDNSMSRDWLNLEHNYHYRIKLGDFSGLYFQLDNTVHAGLWAIDTSRGQLSDDRLKFNETPITNALTTINKLKVLEYDKSEMLGQATTRKEIGLIAQEVYNIPELKCAVQPGDDKHEWCLRYTDIFCVAIQAIQELKREVEKLEARIKTLEGE